MEHGNMARGNMLHGSIMHGHIMHKHKYLSAIYQSDFIVKDVKISTVCGIVGAMLVVIILAGFLEGFKHWLYIRQGNGSNHTQVIERSRHFIFFGDKLLRIADSLHKMLTVTVGYLLMLCVMTMNVWMLIYAVLGAGIGYLLLRPAVKSCFATSRTNHNCDEIGQLEKVNLVKHREHTDVDGIGKDCLVLNRFYNCQLKENGANDQFLAYDSSEKQLIYVL